MRKLPPYTKKFNYIYISIPVDPGFAVASAHQRFDNSIYFCTGCPKKEGFAILILWNN